MELIRIRSLRRLIFLALTFITIFILINVFHLHSPQHNEHQFEKYEMAKDKTVNLLPFYWQETSNGCPNFTYVIENPREEGRNFSEIQATSHPYSRKTHLLDLMKSPRMLTSFNFEDCQMSNCFDLTRCQSEGPIKVHILPSYTGDSEGLPLNDSSLGESNIIHRNILKVIRQSKHYEPDRDKACLFVLEDDTLDRDPLSKSFRHDIQSIQQDYNMYGMNHLIFNLYSGSWPDYKENDFSGLQFGAAIVAKASNSLTHHRSNFDISLPLFSYLLPCFNEVPQSAGSYDKTCDRNCSFFLTFKGKRYVFGRGSDTRNSVYHIHNNRDVIMLTTCKHGKKWKNSSDKRCEQDELNYNKYDFVDLMKQSAFCLVPRGRRLGSFRFIEALSYGCIPVVLSDGWVKPFDEIIDWSCSVIKLPESLLLHTPDLLRDLDQDTISRMKQSSRRIYEQYFSSIERIILTAISVVERRILALRSTDKVENYLAEGVQENST